MRSAFALCISIAAAGCLPVLAACGDSETPSQEQVVEEANRICREQTARFREIQMEPPRSAHDAVEQTGELISVAQEALARFEDLEHPDELAAPLERYLRARRRALERLRQGRAAAERQDRRAYSAALERALDETGKRQELARKLGFGDCSGSIRPGGRSPRSEQGP